MGLEREISDDEDEEEASPEDTESAKKNAEVEDYLVYVTEEEEVADELQLQKIWEEGIQKNNGQLMLPSQIPAKVWKCIKRDDIENQQDIAYLSWKKAKPITPREQERWNEGLLLSVPV